MITCSPKWSQSSDKRKEPRIAPLISESKECGTVMKMRKNRCRWKDVAVNNASQSLTRPRGWSIWSIRWSRCLEALLPFPLLVLLLFRFPLLLLLLLHLLLLIIMIFFFFFLAFSASQCQGQLYLSSLSKPHPITGDVWYCVDFDKIWLNDVHPPPPWGSWWSFSCASKPGPI